MATPTTRREFGKKAVYLGAAALAGGSVLSPAIAQEKLTVAQALHQAVRTRFGKHLSEEQLKNLQRSLAANLAAADALKKIQLANSDEPAFVFQAD